MIEVKKFILRPVSGHSVQDRHLHETVIKGLPQGTIRKPLSKRKAIQAGKNKSCTDTFGFRRPDHNREIYNTGLDKFTKNPWYLPKEAKEDIDNTIDAIIQENGFNPSVREQLKPIMGLKDISLQTMYEIKFGLEKDSLTNKVPSKRITGFRNVVDPGAIPTLISAFKVTLYDESNIFKTDSLKGVLTYHWAENHPSVAQHGQPVNSGIHKYYVAEEMDEVKKTVELHDLENDAIFKFVDLKKKHPAIDTLESNVLYFLASLMKYKDKPLVKGQVRNLQILEKINDFIKPYDKKDSQANIENFLEIVDLFESNPELFYVTYLVQQADNTQVIQRNNGSVYWLSQKLKNQDWYKFTSYERFIQFMYGEMKKVESNAWMDFINELIKEGVVIPTTMVDTVEPEISKKKSK